MKNQSIILATFFAAFLSLSACQNAANTKFVKDGAQKKCSEQHGENSMKKQQIQETPKNQKTTSQDAHQKYDFKAKQPIQVTPSTQNTQSSTQTTSPQK